MKEMVPIQESGLAAELPIILKELSDLKYALDQSSIVAITDKYGEIINVNDLFCEISQYSKGELIGKNHRMINSGLHSKLFFKKMWDTIRSGKVWKGEIRNKAKDGTFYWVHATIIPILNLDGTPEKYISIRTDITDQKMYEEKVKYFAFFDELTDLPNRRKFNMDLSDKIEEVKVNAEESGLSVLFLDLDRFKNINDTKGHNFGDIVLKKVAEKIVECIEGSAAQLYRLGGDEFTIIFENAQEEETKELALRLLDLFSSPISIEEEEFFLSLSIGVSVFPVHGEDTETLIQKADLAMYRSKELGGNRVEVFSNELILHMSNELLLERDLRKAINSNEFTVVYQPKVNLADRTIVGVEALIRWNHPELGMISPVSFIPASEKTGLIVPISKFVFTKVCEDIAGWERENIPLFRVAINFSPFLLEEKNIVHFVKETINEFNLNPKHFEIEITENIMIKHDHALTMLNEIKSLGIHISIDDFGTGFSSLNLIKRFPIDTLKIDRSFISEIGKSSEDDAMIKTIIDIAKNLNLDVVAEGIEKEDQWDFLLKNQCIEGQGFLFSRPISSEAIKAMLSNKSGNVAF